MTTRLLTIAHRLRALDSEMALEEVRGVYEGLAVILGQRPEALRSVGPALDASHQTFAQPATIGYPKAWEKVTRRFFEFIEFLAAGEISSALPALAALEVNLQNAAELRPAFLRERHLISQGQQPLAGMNLGEAHTYFIKPASQALGQRLPTVEHLNKLFDRAAAPTEAALDALSLGDYGAAAETLQRALSIDPGKGDGRMLLGELLRRLDRGIEARGELCFMVEQELAGARLLHGPQERLLSQVRLARAYVSLGRLALDHAELTPATFAFEEALKHLDWAERRGSDGGLGGQDLAHIAAEKALCQGRLSRLHRKGGL